MMHMPTTLCREFVLYGECRGERTELLRVSDNRKRAYHLNLGKTFDRLVLVPQKSWGEDSDQIPVISFDFN